MPLELKVKRESVIRSMNKEQFNNVIADATAVQLMKVNDFEIKRDNKVIGISHSFVCKLTKEGRSTIATLPGAILFSSQVLAPSVEGASDENTAKSFYEMTGEGVGEELDLSQFASFTVKKTISRIENRSNVLAAQGDRNPNKHVFNLRDYAAYDAQLKLVNGVFNDLDFDAVYASGPKQGATEIKDILIQL